MIVQAGSTNSEYLKHGIDLSPSGEFMIDATKPRAIPITALNELTGEIKHYMLRVTSKGGLCLV
jgi:hypothetical protein